MTDIKNNLISIQEKIEKAARKAGRDPGDIRLVAVSKRISAQAVKQAFAAGQFIFGENYLQEAQKKIEYIGEGPEWHFIGHVQSNKAKSVADLFHMVHTVDRLKLARALDKEAGNIGKKLPVLVQVNIGKEIQKSGVMPDQTEGLLEALRQCKNLQVKGLMTMPPYREDPEEVRPFFLAMRKLSEQLAGKGFFCEPGRIELSMGMSHDFHVAVEEGATLVRIGTAIFGQRPSSV